MNLNHVKAILLQELFITTRYVEVIMDLFFFPFINVIVFGFISLYLSGDKQSIAGQYVLLGMLLWQIIWIIQYSVSVGSLWNIWSRNLSNLFIAPLRVREYIFAHALSGTIKALVMLLITMVLSVYIFNFNILNIGIVNLVLTFINLALFAFAIGIAALGLIFRFGTRIQALAWGLVPVFQPLSAAFYPVEVLPFPLKIIAYLFPATFAFEGARWGLLHHTINWQLFGLSFLENAIYLIVCTVFFAQMFKTSKNSGQFARNEG